MWSLSYVWKCTFFPVSIFIEKVIYFTNWYQGDLFSCLTSFTVLFLLYSFLSLGNQNHKSLGFVFHVLDPTIGIAFCPLRVAVLIPPPPLLPLQSVRLEAIFFNSYTFSYSYAALLRFFEWSTAFCSQLCLLTVHSDVSLCSSRYDLSPVCCRAALQCWSCSRLPWEPHLSCTSASINCAMRGISCIKELDRGNARWSSSWAKVSDGCSEMCCGAIPLL